MANNGTGDTSDNEKKIIRQIEYYFGNANLKRDRFLQERVKEDDGWVPLETMIKFNRLKALSEDFNVITTALEKSTSNLIEISEDKTKIRRLPSNALPQDTTEYRKGLRDRTIYCKGFPLEADVGEIQEFLDKFGETDHIYMRRDGDKKFKGSVFATFKEEAIAKKFLEEKSIKYRETEMKKMTKEDYFLKKTEERKQRREDDKQKKQQEKEKRDKEAIEAQKADFGEYEKGCILHFSGTNDQTSREDLKELFADYGTVSWIDYVRGQTEGQIRFDKDTPASIVLEKARSENEGKLVVRGCELETRVLEGEEEVAHWAKIHENMSMVRLKKQQGRKGKFNKGRQAKSKGPRDAEVKFEGKKTVFKDESGDEEEAGDESGNEAQEKVKEKEETKAESKGTKRPLEEKEGQPEESAKQLKTNEETAAESKGTKRPLEENKDQPDESSAKQLKTDEGEKS